MAQHQSQPSNSGLNVIPRMERTGLQIVGVLLASAVACAVPATPVLAQSCGEVWTSVSEVPGTPAPVYAVLPLPSGQVLLGGAFNACRGVAANNIARFDPATGTVVALAGGLDGPVTAMTLLPNGDVLVGGEFANANGQASASLARLDPSLGIWTPLGSSPSGPVYALLTMPDGTVIVGGKFAQANGVILNNIGRFDPDAQSWQSLDAGTSGSLENGRVNALAMLPNGDIVAGGWFDSAGSVSSPCIARFRPASSAWFAVGRGMGLTQFPAVDSLAVLPDGDLLAGGAVVPLGDDAPSDMGLVRYRVSTESWIPTGSLLLESPFIARIFGLRVTPDGQVLVLGSFNRVGGLPAPGLASFSPSDSSWKIPVNVSDAGHRGFAAGVLADGTAVVAGDFYGPGSLVARGVGTFNLQSLHVNPIAGGLSGPASLVSPLADGDLIVCGSFESVDGVPLGRIARNSPATRSWTSLGQGTTGRITAVTECADGSIIFGGSFSAIGGVSANNIARYDPASGAWSPLGAGVTQTGGAWPEFRVTTIREMSNGDLIVGGTFTSAGATSAKNIARYTPSTGAWSTLGAGIASWRVHAVEVLPGGDLLVGGAFTRAGSVNAVNLARFKPTTSAWSVVKNVGTATGLDRVSEILPMSDGRFVIAGTFSQSGGTPVQNIGILDVQAGTVSALGAGVNGLVTGLALLPSGEVAVSGEFSAAGGLPAAQLARVNLFTGAWTALNQETLTNKRADDITVTTTGDLFVAGDFSRLDGVVSYGLAQRTSQGAPAIVQQPESGRFCGKSDVLLEVRTNQNPGDVTFQWRHDGVPIDTTLNPSAGSSTLTISRALAGASGSYDCVVTNPCGSSTSSAATIRVCVADTDCSGSVDLTDFFQWLNAWDTSDPSSDLTGDNAVTTDDFLTFFNAFDTAC